MRRWLTASNLACVAIIAAVAAVVAYANWREPKGPLSSARPLSAARGSTARADLADRIRTLRAGLEEHPDDVAAAVVLADLLTRQARVTGNAGLPIEAERILTRALRDDPGNYDANRMLASLYLSEHRFRDAIAMGEKNRAARPYDPVNYGVIGDGHLELGEYEQAFDAFDRMAALRPGAASYARVAYARELQGNLDGAVSAMKLAADATGAEDLEGLAWTRAQVGGLYLQLGRITDAKVEFAAASQAFPGHPLAVAGYAEAIAAEGDRAGALNLLRSVAAASPTPDVAARIGDLLRDLGRTDEAEQQYALAEAGWRVDSPDPRNLSRFLADHDRKIDEAVRMAEEAASTRQDIFTEDAAAWAYFKAGRVADARTAMARALRTGSRDRDLRAHAVAIEVAASQVASR